MTDEELDTVLTETIERLPARCRFTLIRLKEGATYEDISAELKLDAEAAQRLHARAMEYVLANVRESKAKAARPSSPCVVAAHT
jgi:hypothetical protein